MATMDMSQVPQALADFLDQRVLTALPDASPYRWIIGGASTIVLAKFSNLVKAYAPLLKTLGILDANGLLVIEMVEQFLNSAFEKQQTLRLPLIGVPFKFDKSDGQYLIEALKRHGGING